MKKRFLTAFLITAIVITSLTLTTRTQFARENSAVADMAMMLPDSDVIVAVDMHKTLNVVAPLMFSQDENKLQNLKKLMKTVENNFGLNPYEINQAVIGIKFGEGNSEELFGDVDFTAIIKTTGTNDSMLLDWSKKMDAIADFETAKEPVQRYIEEFKHFRYHKLSKNRKKELEEQKKSFEEFDKGLNELGNLLNSVAKTAKTDKSYKDSVKIHRNLKKMVGETIGIFSLEADSQKLADASIRLQNRWTQLEADDAGRDQKIATILKESAALYPEYRNKSLETIKIETLLNISDYEVSEMLAKKRFGLGREDSSNNIKELLEVEVQESKKTLSTLSAAKSAQRFQLASVWQNLQKIENVLEVRQEFLEKAEQLGDITTEKIESKKAKSTLASDLQKNAKFTEINGRKMITVDLDKIAYWNPAKDESNADMDKAEAAARKVAEAAAAAAEKAADKVAEKTAEQSKTTDTKETPQNSETAEKTTPAEKNDSPPPPKPKNKTVVVVRSVGVDVSDAEKLKAVKTEPKKREPLAVGYLDDKTMVIGFEKGITNILSRNGDYKNPKALEMINSFENPLISFATNTKPFEGFMKAYKTVYSDPSKSEESKETKESPIEKYVKDVTIFGSMEFEDKDSATTDLILSLGFTKNKVEEIFKEEEPKENESPVEIGSYQVTTNLLNDLLNTLKAYKASLSFKFEKKKLAALLETAPVSAEDSVVSEFHPAISENSEKKVIGNMKNIEDLLTSPRFYADVKKALANKRKP